MNSFKILIVLLLVFLFSCGETKKDNKIENYDYLRSEFKHQLDSIWNIASEKEKSYLKFLYKNLPIGDIVEYSPEFHFSNIKTALKSKKIFSWGDNLPETEFRYFVLPYRVNNENLDTSRAFFMNDIKDRIKGMSMLDAALEVNHWCHEHVTYKAADARTSSPLATYKNGYGRCGEESTFTVAALRSVGIPARQVYTPRWAHTDDNHAWVEFWADGKWYFYGACEPAPAENQGWFTEPARRAMLVNTRVIGDYNGDERVLNKMDIYSILNTLNVYAKTKEVFVKVLDDENKAVEDAKVEFLLYNYAEFYPIAIKKTDKNGYTSFESGLGDLIVWASKDNNFAFSELDLRTVDTLNLILSDKLNNNKIEFEINPPIEPEPYKIDKSKKAENDKRLAFEDSVRKAYEQSFIDSLSIIKFAEKYNLNKENTYNVFKKSRANWKQIKFSFENVPAQKHPMLIDLMNNVNDKDLRDTYHKTFIDHILNTEKNENIETEIFNKYVLNPRVRYELITDFRGFLIDKFSYLKEKSEKEIVDNLKSFVLDSIKLIEKQNYYQVAISPEAVYKSRVADKKSQHLFLISALRSYGIPAREEPGTWLPQYYLNGKWNTIYLQQKAEEADNYAFIKFSSQNPDLKYFKHFTLSKFVKGSFRTLQYQWDKPINNFDDSLKLSPGFYRLTTGNRIENGNVLADFEFFKLSEGEYKIINVKLRERALQHKNIKIENSEFEFDTTSDMEVYIWLEEGTEPANHIVNDLAKVKDKLQSKSIDYNVITTHKLSNESLNKYFKTLPSGVKYLVDNDLKNLKYIETVSNENLAENLPVVIIRKADKIIFIKKGYTIGIGEEILKYF